MKSNLQPSHKIKFKFGVNLTFFFHCEDEEKTSDAQGIKEKLKYNFTFHVFASQVSTTPILSQSYWWPQATSIKAISKNKFSC